MFNGNPHIINGNPHMIINATSNTSWNPRIHGDREQSHGIQDREQSHGIREKSIDCKTQSHEIQISTDIPPQIHHSDGKQSHGIQEKTKLFVSRYVT